MQITISGPRGGGSTTLAVEIAKFLTSRGQDVVFKSRCTSTESMLRDLAKGQCALTMDRKARIVIVEGLEGEEEQGVSCR